MNVLLIGGQGCLINNLIGKMKKEGHRVYLLTGSRHGNEGYIKVFEKYEFTYDTLCLNDIFHSTSPDITIYMGAHDSNYKWSNEEADAARYTTCLMNILMGYSSRGKGRFIYLSSDEVFRGSYPYPITEEEELKPIGHKSITLAQCEQMCESFNKTRGLDVITLRLDHLYKIPESKDDITSLPEVMCLQAVSGKPIDVCNDDIFSPLFVNDAVEYIYRVASVKEHNRDLYNIAAGEEYSTQEIAELVCDAYEASVYINVNITSNVNERVHLSNALFDSEFGCNFFCKTDASIRKIADKMKKNPDLYIKGADAAKTRLTRLIERLGWLLAAIFPFVENILFAFAFTFIGQTDFAGQYLAKVDFYLLYVLIFAVVYGQQQAGFAGLFATIAFAYTRLQDMTPGELLLDSNTYVWLAQLFVIGLGIGHMKDVILRLKDEAEEEKEFISQQLNDIQDINSSNVRVKDALETQILNQSDSVGKIYSITSALDQYSQDEVLFYAAEMIGRLMNSRDVAIYTVSNGDYARLFAATSTRARVMGNSLKYTATEDVYDALMDKKVFINRKMDQRWPMMVSGIYEGDHMQVMIMVWGLPWESMTLGQANQLTVIGSLIQNAVLRANRYLAVLADERYAADSKMMETEAFRSLVTAYANAQKRGLTECVMLQMEARADANLPAEHAGQANILAGKLRDSDYIGTLPDNNLYVLLSNTSDEGASIIMNRFSDMGFSSRLIKISGLKELDKIQDAG